MQIRIIGESPCLEGQSSRFRKGIGTIFPARKVIVTLPGIHATQRLAFIDELDEQQIKDRRPGLGQAEIDQIIADSVNLYFDGDCILIRPDPENLELAFDADEVLQTLTSKTNIKFLQVSDELVLHAIKQRGESWRITPLPRSPFEIREMILNARIGIHGEAIYYHNRFTGSRLLTCEAFHRLGKLSAEDLANHLDEIREFAGIRNRLGYLEIVFFQAGALGAEQFASYDFKKLCSAELLRVFNDLGKRFASEVSPVFQRDNVEDPEWRQGMFSALVGQSDKSVADEILLGLSSEYFLQLQWLPGCRIQGGEIFPDTVFDEFLQSPERRDLAALCDPKVRNFIFNAVREYGELDYMNVAHIPSALSRGTMADERRGVYLAEIKPKQQAQPVVRIIRMQKWDVSGHLDNGKDLLDAVLQSSEYTDYVLDRRLACRQLGMNLVPRIQMCHLREVYQGPNRRWQGQVVWSTYFERDYCHGIATDKISPAKLVDSAYALILARLLGKAAAPNLIVGRQDHNFRVLFDDGDEIVREDKGLPVEIVIGDATGAFADYTTTLDHFSRYYAQPVLRRWQHLKRPEEFAEAYLGAFASEFARIQEEYFKRRRAFDALFHHCIADPKGNLAFRWVKILARLEHTQPADVAECIRKEIHPG